MRKLAYMLALLVAVGLLAAGGTMTGGAKTSPGIAWDLGVSIPTDTDFGTPAEVLPPGTGLWDDILWGGAPCAAVKHEGTYYLYYVGSDNYDDIGGTVENRAIGVATSTDGINFTKYAGNPIVTYSTGAYPEEGATNAVVVVDSSGTWHMWYGASRYTGPSAVDVDIRYRTSTDGLLWTGDTLVYSVAGNEYVPNSAFYDGTNWNVYYTGNLTSGKGPLNRMYGTNPATVANNAQVLAGTWFSSNGMHRIDGDTWWLVIAGNAAAWAPSWYTIENSAPQTLSSEIDNYAFTGYARFSVLLDREREEWKLYQIDVSGGANDGSIVVRTAPVAFP